MLSDFSCDTKNMDGGNKVLLKKIEKELVEINVSVKSFLFSKVISFR